MKAKSFTLEAVATALVAGLLVPGLVRAQTVPPPEFTEARANVAIQHRAGFEEALKLYLKAAEQRSETDPLGVTDLVMAAGVAYQTGNPGRARELFVQASGRALQMGDVYGAADWLLKAAIIANQQRDPARDDLIARAQRLASSPLLTVPQRDHILNQFARTQLAAGTK